MAGAAALTLAATAQDRALPPAEPALYFFFSPDTPGLDDAVRRARASGVALRPVLLATNYKDWTASFATAAGELGDVAMMDEDGLALARRFGVTRTPCFVHVTARGVHRATGSRVDLKELLSCGR